MSVDGHMLEHIITEVKQLSPEDRVRLIQQVAESLLAGPQPARPKQLVYGQFEGTRKSTEEDFADAEWRPMERDLNGP